MCFRQRERFRVEHTDRLGLASGDMGRSFATQEIHGNAQGSAATGQGHLVEPHPGGYSTVANSSTRISNVTSRSCPRPSQTYANPAMTP